MPLYALKCPNGHTFEEFARFEERDAIKCPHCGRGECGVDYGAQTVRTEPTFIGERSLSKRLAFHPDEVEEARRELPSLEADDKGRVYFRSPSHLRRFEKDVMAMREREKQKAGQG